MLPIHKGTGGKAGDVVKGFVEFLASFLFCLQQCALLLNAGFAVPSVTRGTIML
jgi:hypothetical protein